MPQNQRPAAPDALRQLRDETRELQRWVRLLRSMAGKPRLDRGDQTLIPNPTEGQVMVNLETGKPPGNKPWHYAEGAWRPFHGPAVLERKLFADPNALDGNLPPEVTDVVVGDGKFIFSIDKYLDDWYVVAAQAFVSTAGGGDTVVEVENVTQSQIIVAALTIPSGELTTPCDEEADIDLDNDQVAGCDIISLNVTQAGTGAQGLGVYLSLFPVPLDA